MSKKIILPLITHWIECRADKTQQALSIEFGERSFMLYLSSVVTQLNIEMQLFVQNLEANAIDVNKEGVSLSELEIEAHKSLSRILIDEALYNMHIYDLDIENIEKAFPSVFKIMSASDLMQLALKMNFASNTKLSKVYNTADNFKSYKDFFKVFENILNNISNSRDKFKETYAVNNIVSKAKYKDLLLRYTDLLKYCGSVEQKINKLISENDASNESSDKQYQKTKKQLIKIQKTMHEKIDDFGAIALDNCLSS